MCLLRICIFAGRIDDNTLKVFFLNRNHFWFHLNPSERLNRYKYANTFVYLTVLTLNSAYIKI